MKTSIQFGKRLIAEDQPCFIIAELSANHKKDLTRAKEIIKAAHDCGVDAVKVQTYTEDTLTIDCTNEHFKIKHPVWGGKTLYELYQEASMPWNWLKELKGYAEDLGLVFFSTAYDPQSADYLEELDMPGYKISSFELVDIPLIQYISGKQKPVILSTGMGSLDEIALAVATVKAVGNDQLMLLKCTSAYPAKAENMNLKAMSLLREKFQCLVGLSDHSLSNDVAVAAVALGAKVVEKHMTLSRNDPGPDAHFSLEPHEMKGLVNSIRNIELALGEKSLQTTEGERDSIVFRKSLFSVADIKKGEPLSEKNIRVIRPGHGLAPKYYGQILGKKALLDISRGTPLALNMIESLS